MNIHQKILRRFCYIMLIFITLLSVIPAAYPREGENKEITPTDVYNLAKAIDDSLVAMYDLNGVFEKKRLSNNIRPRNSYQKLLAVVDEFNLLHGNVIPQSKLDEARRADILTVRPGDIYNLLLLIKEYLVKENRFIELSEIESNKTPSDVTHILRQISFHNVEIANKKNISTNWSTPEQVYSAIINDILPVIKSAAEESGLEYEDYLFPMQPEIGVVPRNITKLLQHLYQNLSEYYKAKGYYDPLVLIEVNDCDEISPGDSFDLIKAISAELKSMSGDKRLDSKTRQNYEQWKTAKSGIVPGDVYRLLRYLYIMSRRILEKSGR